MDREERCCGASSSSTCSSGRRHYCLFVSGGCRCPILSQPRLTRLYFLMEGQLRLGAIGQTVSENTVAVAPQSNCITQVLVRTCRLLISRTVRAPVTTD